MRDRRGVILNLVAVATMAGTAPGCDKGTPAAPAASAPAAPRDVGGVPRPDREAETRPGRTRPATTRSPGVGPPPFAAPVVEALQLIERGAFAEGRARAEAHLAAHPEDAGAALAIGLSYHRARDYPSAAPWLENARELDPSDSRVLHFLGYCRFYLGELDLARAAFAAHVAADPEESDSHFGLALVAIEEGEFDEARTRLEHAIELIRELEETNPPHYNRRKRDIAKCHARLGDIAFAMGEYEEAKRLFEEAISVDPNQYTTYHRLSQIERRLGNDARADELQQVFEGMAARRQGRPPDG